MYIINELNPHFYMACFRRTGGLELMPVNLLQDHFQYLFQLLEFGNVKNRIIEIAYSSGMRSVTAVNIFFREGVGKFRIYNSR